MYVYSFNVQSVIIKIKEKDKKKSYSTMLMHMVQKISNILNSNQ